MARSRNGIVLGVEVDPNEPLPRRSPALVAFEGNLYAGLRQLTQLELPRESAAALAEALQGQLAGDAHGRIPYSQELELLMRAVLAILKGGDDPNYVAVKLRGGVFQLVSSLYRRMPGFAARVEEEELLQAILGDYYRPPAG